MRILIELPTWLGDTVMASPAIENLINHFKDPKITIIGSKISIETFKNHPKIINYFLLNKNYYSNYQIAKKLGEFDIFFSFRSSIRARIFKSMISSKIKYQFEKKNYSKSHQVKKYNRFINQCLGIEKEPGKLIIYGTDIISKKNKFPCLGINPGSSYGSAKRWYPEEFADVAIRLSKYYDILIFGGPDEKNIASDIEKILIKNKIKNYQNLVGKTSIKELIENISKLDLFVTGDSGPMHLAASFQIPTVTIFGPTNDEETSQWKNQKSINIKKNLECQPCMSRKCPLKHHNCMKKIKSNDVIRAIKSF